MKVLKAEYRTLIERHMLPDKSFPKELVEAAMVGVTKEEMLDEDPVRVGLNLVGRIVLHCLVLESEDNKPVVVVLQDLFEEVAEA